LLPLWLLTVLEGVEFDRIWCARDALALLRPMDRLTKDRVSGERRA
jgi:hypothetical protein